MKHLKVPAFEPVFIQNATQFSNIFGGQSTQKLVNGNLQFALPYYANSYLSQSNQLWVTRVLGLSGYNAGTAWAIRLDAGVNPNTIVAGTTVTHTGVPFGYPTPNQYLGVTLPYSGATGSLSTGFTKVGNIFQEYVHNFTATTKTITGGTVTDKVTTRAIVADVAVHDQHLLIADEGVLRAGDARPLLAADRLAAVPLRRVGDHEGAGGAARGDARLDVVVAEGREPRVGHAAGEHTQLLRRGIPADGASLGEPAGGEVEGHDRSPRGSEPIRTTTTRRAAPVEVAELVAGYCIRRPRRVGGPSPATPRSDRRGPAG